ncbi:hypothetical protein AB0P17_37870, partial [Streptomyces sp. NPDC088124]|uniref:hypothetical protein n=1 Tax=Streptomyces sp. NPDC088124 TaxID=3154654 RepID=UPI0034313687
MAVDTTQTSDPGPSGDHPDGTARPARAHVIRGPEKAIRRLERVIIRFAGDSGDGMQLTGDRFTSETAS